MKAVRIHQFGGPEVLTYEDVPDPKPRQDQVLVRVRACALNHLDIWVRKGLPGVNLPHILGTDAAGEIVEVGEHEELVRRKDGQRIENLTIRQLDGRRLHVSDHVEIRYDSPVL